MRLFAHIAAILIALPLSAQGVSFTGTASCVDDRDGDISTSTEWESDVQGTLGVGSPLQFDLNEGTHIVLARCTDAAGNVATASQSVTVVIEDTTPPTLSITVEPTQQASLYVTPEDPVNGQYSLRLEPQPDGSATYVSQVEGVASPNGTLVEDWGTAVRVGVTIDHGAALFQEGFEMVVVRVDDPAERPLFDLILAGTAAQPEAMARVYDASGPLTTMPVLLTEARNTYSVEWSQDAGQGYIRLLTGAESREIIDLDTDREMHRLMVGAPVTTAGFTGYLLFDDVEVYSL